MLGTEAPQPLAEPPGPSLTFIEVRMAHKKKHSGPVPPDNQPKIGPAVGPGQPTEADEKAQPHGAPFEEQDPKHRLGNFTGKGEHSFQQPGGRNDANH